MWSSSSSTRPVVQVRHRAVRAVAIALALGAMPLQARGQIAVIGNAVDEHPAAAGQRYDGTIVVRNLTTQSQPVRIYQTDYMFFADGSSHFDSAGSTPRSNARWVTPGTRSLTIPPSADVTLTYVVQVPAIDSLRGTYWSAIMVEAAPTAPPVTGARQLGIGSVIRYAVQVATQLPDVGARRVRLTKSAFASDTAGTRRLDVIVQNTGDRAYRPNLWVELYDAAGVLRGRLEHQRGLLYPGTSVKQSFTFVSLPRGSYKALFFADTGDDTVVAAQYRLDF
jgi:hypothetical protein